ncbi:MAG: isoprenyl transferase [Simkania sp.]|nr:isoprenyl transferase [Simkania sp.]
MNALVVTPLSPESLFTEEDLHLLDPLRIPEHVAIIMDGNRRWAKQRALPGIVGHTQGAAMLRKVVQAATELGIRVLTVYAFSTENWQRSPIEIKTLMHIFKSYLRDQRESMIKQGVRLETIGDLSKFPEDILKEICYSKEATKHCAKIDLVLALNYGGRDDLRRAVQAMIEDHATGRLSGEKITENIIAGYLDTAQWKDPELFIRTSGEKRLSNFLLWQLSYAEVYITDVLWPDFDEKELLNAVLDFQQRNRRWGG